MNDAHSKIQYFLVTRQIKDITEERLLVLHSEQKIKKNHDFFQPCFEVMRCNFLRQVTQLGLSLGGYCVYALSLRRRGFPKSIIRFFSLTLVTE